MKIIYKKYFDFPFERYELLDKAKMIGQQRLSSVWAFRETEKNIQLALRHDELLAKYEKLRDELSDIVHQMEGKIK